MVLRFSFNAKQTINRRLSCGILMTSTMFTLLTQKERYILSVVSDYSSRRKVFWSISGKLSFFFRGKKGERVYDAKHFHLQEKESISPPSDLLVIERGFSGEAFSFVLQNGDDLAEKALWHMIAVSDLYEVWERVPEGYGGTVPYRFLFSEEEKKAQALFARKSLQRKLSEKEKDIYQKECDDLKEGETVTLSLTLWCFGEIRGVGLVRGRNKERVIEQAVAQALLDRRCKPLTPSEFDAVTIAFNYVSDMALPLFSVHTPIMYDAAYGVLSQNEKLSWLLPRELVQRGGDNVFDLLKALSLYEEAPASLEGQTYKTLFIAKTCSFVSSPFDKNLTQSDMVVTGREESLVEGILSFFKRVQEADGFFRSHYALFSTVERAMDWRLFSFTIKGLALYGEKKREESAIAIARKAYLYHKDMVILNGDLFTLLYTLETAVIFKDKEVVKKIEDILHVRHLELAHNALFALSYLRFQSTHKKDFLRERGQKEKVESVMRSFREESVSCGAEALAKYADIMPLLMRLNDLYPHEGYDKDAERVYKVFASLQQTDGSFVSQKGGTDASLRATIKILEGMAEAGFLTKESVIYQKGFDYIAHSQYTEETMYMLVTAQKERLRGALREHERERVVWIDACGHACRLLSLM